MVKEVDVTNIRIPQHKDRKFVPSGIWWNLGYLKVFLTICAHQNIRRENFEKALFTVTLPNDKNFETLSLTRTLSYHYHHHHHLLHQFPPLFILYIVCITSAWTHDNIWINDSMLQISSKCPCTIGQPFYCEVSNWFQGWGCRHFDGGSWSNDFISVSLPLTASLWRVNIYAWDHWPLWSALAAGVRCSLYSIHLLLTLT